MSDPAPDRGTQLTRIALLVCLAFALLLLATLAVARPAHALTLPQAPGVLANAAPVEPDEGEDEDWETWEEGEWEDEEDEEAEEEGNSPHGKSAIYIAPPECLLRTADAKAVVYAAQDKIDLTIRYTALAPVDVMIDYRFHGGKGSLSLTSAKRFTRHGVLHQVEHLGKAQAAKARAAKDVSVQLRLPSRPEGCESGTFLRHLSAKRPLSSQTIWLDSLGRSARRH
ncbi:MAG TPA: hypothetical protein VG518_02400 [Solirubrobacterales bacterium]|nr:hypothetical protein [Solirubrobacterales bacterium]